MAARRDKRARQARREEKALPSYAGRRFTVLGLFGLDVALLVWRAVDQQILEKDFLQSEGADRYLTKSSFQDDSFIAAVWELIGEPSPG